jgi:hypothetical protein
MSKLTSLNALLTRLAEQLLPAALGETAAA